LLVKPSWIVPDILEIDTIALWEQGIRGIVFDLDNTIMRPHTGILEPDMEVWLKQLLSKGFQIIVVSNNPLVRYTQAAEKTLGLTVIGNAGKPRRAKTRQALQQMNLEAHQVVIVGDRPLTDIWVGQRLGCQTILVNPLNKKTENTVVQGLRWLERRFVIQ
jgi:uncharacterized protein